VLEKLSHIECELRRELSDFEPERVTTAQAASVLKAACAIEQLAGSLRLLATRRAAESRIWASEGHRSAASWVSEVSKSSYGEALSMIETAEQLACLPQTTEALRNGELSRAQVKEVTVAASDHPAEESDLLRVAAEGTVKKLKDHARQIKARAASMEDEVSRHRSIHRRRYMRHWSEPDGAFHLDARLTPESGARLLASVRQEADRIFGEARCSGEHEHPHAYEADALVSLTTGSRRSLSSRQGTKGGHGARRADTVVVRVDAGALKRGFVKGDETCEIPGVGRVPVATARRVLGEGFLKILVTDGVDVTTVCHVGRSVPAHLQTALDERDRECVVPGCEVANGLEMHHWRVDFAQCKTTSLEGLARVCKRHHDQITYDGCELTGGPGSWILNTPSSAAGFDTS